MGLVVDAYCTMIGAHILNEERGGSGRGDDDKSSGLSLQNLASMELGVDNWGKGAQQFGDKNKRPTQLYGDDGMGFYCARDVGYTHLIKERQRSELRSHPRQVALLRTLVFPGLQATYQMEMNGIWVDPERAKGRRAILKEAWQKAYDECLLHVPEELRKTADVDNDNFLRKWLFADKPGGLGLPPVTVTVKRREPQVNEAVLTALAELHPVPKLVLDFRRAAKGISFIDQWFWWSDPEGRLHPSFNLTGTVTGRRSCDKPNLQQVPRSPFMRSILGAPPGWVLLEVDYSQIEVRLAAWAADEQEMLRIYREGGDIYRHTAAVIMGIPRDQVTKDQRQKAKAVVLGFLYGMGWKKFGVYAKESYGVDISDDEAELFHARFFALYPALVTWHDRMKKTVRKHLQVESPLGRIRHLIRILSSDRFEQFKAERQAINSPIQGMGGDLTLASNAYLAPVLPPDEALVVGDVHDALLFQLRAGTWKKWARVILATMERPPPVLELLQMEPPVRLLAEGKIATHWNDEQVTEFALEQLDLPYTEVDEKWEQKPVTKEIWELAE